MLSDRKAFLAACASLLLAASIAGCAAPPPVMAQRPVCPNPPPPVGDITTPPPPVSGARQILLPGHWEWLNGSYAFTGPRWLPWPGGGTPLWQPGSWHHDNAGNCQWIPGQFVQQ